MSLGRRLVLHAGHQFKQSIGQVDRIARMGRAGTGLHAIYGKAGLRCLEVVGLWWNQVDVERKILHVRCRKGGTLTVHPLTRTELAWLRKLAGNDNKDIHVFITERNGPVSEPGFFKIVARASREAGLDFHLDSHMLIHSLLFKLANEGRDTRIIQDYLGHANIQRTVRYAKLAPGRFDGLFKD